MRGTKIGFWKVESIPLSWLVVLSLADRDAGAEGREEGSVWLYAHQLTALSHTPTHWHQPCSEPLLMHSDFHLNLFTVISLLSEALIWNHASEGMLLFLPYLGWLLYHWCFTSWNTRLRSLFVFIVIGFGSVLICLQWSNYFLYFLVFDCIM